MFEIVLLQLGVAIVHASLWFLASMKLRRNDVADVAWGISFVLLTLPAWLATSNSSSRAMLVLVLVMVWGVRLSLHIGARNRGKSEDSRYRKWREEWGDNAALRAYFQVFVLQGLLAIVVLVPITYVFAQRSSELGMLDAIGLTVWLVGFLFEAVGDFQLVRFKSDPGHRGQFITSGLWRFTRHPNYFGEVTMWWGTWLIACSSSGGWTTVVGPATITVLILWVSGIPLLEKKYEGNPEFERYRQRTSAFFPLPQRKR